MKWGEFKKKIESQGIDDNFEILFIVTPDDIYFDTLLILKPNLSTKSFAIIGR